MRNLFISLIFLALTFFASCTRSGRGSSSPVNPPPSESMRLATGTAASMHLKSPPPGAYSGKKGKSAF